MDITPLVQNRVDGSTPNYVLLLIYDSLTSIGLKASEYSSGSRPYLEITYRDKTSSDNSDSNNGTNDNPGNNNGDSGSNSADSDRTIIRTQMD